MRSAQNPPVDPGCGGPGEHILLTGATGFLGWQVLVRLHRKWPEAQFLLPVRERGGQGAEKRMAHMIAHTFSPEGRAQVSSRIEVLAADLTEERLGLRPEEYNRVAGRITRIIHAAANVDFGQPLSEARRINVGGTQNILELARSASRTGLMRRLVYVSTAFIAGRRAGLVREDELDQGQDFRNSYERSKSEAEGLVREAMPEVPSVVVRPSIIVGDSHSGVTSSFKALYWPLRVYASRYWRLVPGYPDAIVDMVPVDFVADAIVHLTCDDRAVGRCIHLCAGPEGSASVGAIAGKAAEYFGLTPPRFVNPILYLALLKPLLLLLLWDRRRRILRAGKVYRPYFANRTLFDITGATELLGPVGIRPPPVMQYMENLFSYCLESDWGRRK